MNQIDLNICHKKEIQLINYWTIFTILSVILDKTDLIKLYDLIKVVLNYIVI